MDTQATKYQVIDGQTGLVVGEYSNKKRARNKADKLDNEYGAYRYTVKTINPPLPCSNMSEFDRIMRG